MQINNHCFPHEVLIVKDDEDQYFNYRRPNVRQQILHNTIMTRLIHKTLTKATINQRTFFAGIPQPCD